MRPDGLVDRIYRSAPPWGQSALLTVYGSWLRHLRYGGDHRRILAELRASQWRDAESQRAAQTIALRRLVTHARATVPFYRDRFVGVSVRSLEDLEQLPLLTKSEVRAAGSSLVSTASQGRPHTIHTGGTTGSPLTIHCDRGSLRRNYAFFARFLEWAGVSTRARVATFAGRVLMPSEQSRPPYWRRNFAGHALLCSSYHLSPETLPAYADALRRFRPEFIDSYPSALGLVARYLLDAGVRDIRPRAVITSSETLDPATRAVLSQAFGCPVYDHYGSAEMVALITQCRAGRYHVNPEYGIVEVRREGRAARPGEVGEVIATGFVNSRMPLIRYATGDLAEVGEDGCPCGRAFPVLAQLIGRQDEVVVTPEGRRVGRLDPVFKSASTMLETRIVQDRPDHIRVETVLGGPWPAREQEVLLAELRRRLGPSMRIDLVPVPRLERGAGGKLRSVVNLVAQAETNDPADENVPAGRA